MATTRSSVPADAICTMVVWAGIQLDVFWMRGRVEERGWWVFPLGQNECIACEIDLEGGQDLPLWAALNDAVEAVERSLSLRSNQDADDIEHQRLAEAA